MRTIKEKINKGDLVWIDETNELGVVKGVYKDGNRYSLFTAKSNRGKPYYLVHKISAVDAVTHFFTNEKMKPYLLTRMIWVKTGKNKNIDIDDIDPLVKKCMRYAPK